MKRLNVIVTIFLSSLFVTNSLAADSLELKGATIRGNRELPKILYVVPWKQAQRDHIASRPVTRLLSEELEPINRDIFVQRLEYYQRLEGKK